MPVRAIFATPVNGLERTITLSTCARQRPLGVGTDGGGADRNSTVNDGVIARRTEYQSRGVSGGAS